VTGTDEHGMKIQKAAQSKDMTPIELCDKVSLRFKVIVADYVNKRGYG
jgi:methionyl-tRNA synthetase